MVVIVVIDVVLWDIKVKVVNMLLYQLFGGVSCIRMFSYSYVVGEMIEEIVEKVVEFIECGFKVVCVQSGIFGMLVIYGVDKVGIVLQVYECLCEMLWDMLCYLWYMFKLLVYVCDVVGDEFYLFYDVYYCLILQEVVRFVKLFELFDLFWLEDLVFVENQEVFCLIWQYSMMLFAVGEVFNLIYDCWILIQEGLIDYICIIFVYVGGIMYVCCIVDLVGLYYVCFGSYGVVDMLLIMMGVVLYFDCWVFNFGIQEYVFYLLEVQEVFLYEWWLEDGYLLSGEKLGYGVEFNEVVVVCFLYQCVYLDVVCLLDGMLWNWQGDVWYFEILD